MKKLLFLLFLAFFSGGDKKYVIKLVDGLEEQMDYFSIEKHNGELLVSAVSVAGSRAVPLTHLYTMDLLNDGRLGEPLKVKNRKFYRNKIGVACPSICLKTNEVFFSIEGNYIAICKGVVGKNGFEDVKELHFCNQDDEYLHPAISSDGKTLFFISLKNNCQIYQSTRMSIDGEWSIPEPVIELEDSLQKAFPKLINDTTLVFSKSMGFGNGSWDIFTSKKSVGMWSKPEKWTELNSDKDDFSVEMIDEKRGYFCSSRDYSAAKIYYFEIPE